MGGSILVVEDEAAVRDLLAANLQRAGYKVMCAGDVPQAEALVRDTRPDLVLLDWVLPGIPGPDLRAPAALRPAHQGHLDRAAHGARRGAGQGHRAGERLRRLRHQAVLRRASCWRASRR